MKSANSGICGVAHIVENLEIGGLEKVVLNLASHMDTDRYRPVVVCLGYGGELVPEIERAGLTVHALSKKQGIDVGVMVRLAKLLRRERIRVVHCHNLGPLIYGAPASRLARTSGLVYTAHGVKTSSRKKAAWFLKLGFVDDFIAVSNDARRVAIEVAGVPRGKITTIINGVDVNAYAEAAGKTRRRAGEERTPGKRTSIGIPEDAVVFGIVARLSAEKDHENLFRAFRKVADQYADTRLVLVGDGDLRGHLENRVAELGLDGRIVFLGSRYDVAELLGTFDFFVLSSYTEGLAVTLPEAMAAGLPIVATDVGGNAEVVVAGETGLIVKPRDTESLAGAMNWMVSNRAGAGEMGRRGRERARELFGIETMVTHYQNTYENIVRNGK